MARAASTAAGLRRTDISAVNANDVYAQKCSTLKLMCKLLRAQSRTIRVKAVSR